MIALGSLFAGVGITWMIYTQFFSVPKVQFKTTAYEITSATQGSVSFQVLGMNRPAVCAIQILDQSYGIAGYREVEIAVSKPSDLGRWNDYTTTLNTIEKGVSGVVDKCWLK